MRLLDTIIIIFVGSFLFQYFGLSLIMSNSLSNIENSLGKFYIALIVGVFAVLLEILMRSYHYESFNAKYFAFFFILFVFFIYLHKKQYMIKEKEYLKEMIEHHSMALLTSEQILEKTNDYEVTKLAKNIIQVQKDEIDIMKSLLTKMK
jgi:hypothetical protein